MILLAAAALAVLTPASIPEPAASSTSPCPELVTPEALVCRALDARDHGDSQGAAQAFEQAAQASPLQDPATTRLWAASGNMWLIAGRAGKAAFALDRALSLPGLTAEQLGEAQLDRARAAEAQDDLKTARARLDQAASSIAQDPFYWYFSAAVAVREQQIGRAQSDIGHALSLAPADPTILFEAGRIAQLSGDVAGARAHWARVVELDPKSEAGREARGALNALPVPLTVKNEVAEPERQ